MARRLLALVLVLAVTVSGFQPAYGSTDSPAAIAKMTQADGSDCPKSSEDDCCDQTDKTKRLCQWNDACASRCHVNAGLEAVAFAPLVSIAMAGLMAFHEPTPLPTRRAVPHFRPPIL
jgi:hypothetical protein